MNNLKFHLSNIFLKIHKDSLKISPFKNEINSCNLYTIKDHYPKIFLSLTFRSIVLVIILNFGQVSFKKALLSAILQSKAVKNIFLKSTLSPESRPICFPNARMTRETSKMFLKNPRLYKRNYRVMAPVGVVQKCFIQILIKFESPSTFSF